MMFRGNVIAKVGKERNTRIIYSRRLVRSSEKSKTVLAICCYGRFIPLVNFSGHRHLSLSKVKISILKDHLILLQLHLGPSFFRC